MESEEKSNECSLLEYRVCTLTEEMTADSIVALMTQLLKWDMESDERIIIIINSYGGDAYSGFGLYDLVRGLRSPVYTICVGAAFSMASILLVAGTKRYILPHTTILIHQPRNAALPEEMKADHAECESKELNILRDKMVDIYAAHTKLGKAKLKTMLRDEYFIQAEEALFFGFVDEITTDLRTIISSR